MESIKNTVIGALETVKDKLESNDENVANRPKVFSYDG